MPGGGWAGWEARRRCGVKTGKRPQAETRLCFRYSGPSSPGPGAPVLPLPIPFARSRTVPGFSGRKPPPPPHTRCRSGSIYYSGAGCYRPHAVLTVPVTALILYISIKTHKCSFPCDLGSVGLVIQGCCGNTWRLKYRHETRDSRPWRFGQGGKGVR
jgi:hypothetical protein